MKNIPRYQVDGDGYLFEDAAGPVCKWRDVETSQKEAQELRTQFLATIMLLPPETTMSDIGQYVAEARELFLGKDKKLIAQLQDELNYAKEALLHATRPPRPGVNAVYGVGRSSKGLNLRIALMLTAVNHAPNGGLDIEVQLP